MANSVRPKFGLPGGASGLSYTAAEALTAGQLVEARTGTRLVGIAASGSQKVKGVVQDDIPTSRAYIGGPQVGDGNEAVVWRRCRIQVTADGAITAGAKLKVGASGKAKAWVSGTDDASLIVGEAAEAASDGATFNADIY